MASNKKRVLVVDDDPELLQLVKVLLGRINAEAIMAENAEVAAQILVSGPLPDLVILDMMLPDVSGVEFLRQMRSKPVFDNLPVLILSALIDPERIRAALDAGADRYLTKPYIANNLLTVVQDILRTGRKIT
ncbi:MAG TPA: response regulator [Phototrophicaceae bacterium]|nr:response regulator [Phototrophicaceae bacterium]